MRSCNGECKGMAEDDNPSDVCWSCQSSRNARMQAQAAATAEWTLRQRAAAMVGAPAHRIMGSLERYFGEYGRVCDGKNLLRSPVAGSFSHSKRLADEHEQHRISACCAMFTSILTDLTDKLEAMC